MLRFLSARQLTFQKPSLAAYKKYPVRLGFALFSAAVYAKSKGWSCLLSSADSQAALSFENQQQGNLVFLAVVLCKRQKIYVLVIHKRADILSGAAESVVCRNGNKYGSGIPKMRLLRP